MAETTTAMGVVTPLHFGSKAMRIRGVTGPNDAVLLAVMAGEVRGTLSELPMHRGFEGDGL